MEINLWVNPNWKIIGLESRKRFMKIVILLKKLLKIRNL
jgi:hypothetical protein